MAGDQRSRITAAIDRVVLKTRHSEAWDAAEADPVDWGVGLASLRGRKYCLLTTYRRDGEPMPSPVWFGVADGKLYLSSEDAIGKVKRIRNDPRVRIAPATSRGKPLGPPIEGLARILPPEEAARAERAIAANYGLGRKLYEGAGHTLSVARVYVEVAAT
jgi:uncharacterized protein